jgi:hypothetical protein
MILIDDAPLALLLPEPINEALWQLTLGLGFGRVRCRNSDDEIVLLVLPA